jgi:hypothetical protein
MLEPMTLPTLQDTVSGSATARRLKPRLNPGGGQGRQRPWYWHGCTNTCATTPTLPDG